MRTPRTDRDKVRSEILNFKVTPALKQKIIDKADESGVTMSTMANIILNDFFKKEELK